VFWIQENGLMAGIWQRFVISGVMLIPVPGHTVPVYSPGVKPRWWLLLPSVHREMPRWLTTFLPRTPNGICIITTSLPSVWEKSVSWEELHDAKSGMVPWLSGRCCPLFLPRQISHTRCGWFPRCCPLMDPPLWRLCVDQHYPWWIPECRSKHLWPEWRWVWLWQATVMPFWQIFRDWKIISVIWTSRLLELKKVLLLCRWTLNWKEYPPRWCQKRWHRQR